LGIANQGGDSYFLNRYALQRHGAFDQAAAMRMALEHQNPLYAMPVTGGPDGVLPQDTLSALTISNPSVILWALKPAEDGISQGVIARVWNCSSSSEQFALGFPNYLVNTANRTTHIETVTGPAQLVGESLSETLASQWMQTYLIGVQPITGISSKSPMPEGYSLSQNFPNPFNGESQIQFRVPESVHVRMRLFNILGQVEATLLDDSVSPGTHHVNLNTNALGMGSGVYFCRMEAGRFVSVIKVVLIK
jgi:hypothetical protein